MRLVRIFKAAYVIFLSPIGLKINHYYLIIKSQTQLPLGSSDLPIFTPSPSDDEDFRSGVLLAVGNEPRAQSINWKGAERAERH